jgi:hypothetical protein
MSEEWADQKNVNLAQPQRRKCPPCDQMEIRNFAAERRREDRQCSNERKLARSSARHFSLRIEQQAQPLCPPEYLFAKKKGERAAPGAAVVASPEAIRRCPVCGQGMTARRTSACSDRCRAAKSRRKRIPLPVDEYRGIRARLTAALEAVWQVKTSFGRYGQG